jgi:molybdenum cofactor biosynthesis protein B
VSEHDLRQFVKTNFAVIIISDTRNEKTDESGKIAREIITDSGHEIKAYQIIPNDKAQIRRTVKKLLQNPEVGVILTSGGTGISKRDITIDTLTELLDKEIEGFGELFRRLSYEEVGGAAMISRTTAGATNGKLVFCLPGSKSAVRLALTKLILPGLGHMIKEANR